MTAQASEYFNLRASVLRHLEDSTATATLAKSAWLVGGGRDLETKALTEWVEIKVLQTLGRPSRGSRESSVLLQIDVNVRPGLNVHRRELIADAFGIAVANQSIAVGDHAIGSPATVIGNLRTYDAGYVDLGQVNGLWTGSLTIDAFFTPE